MHNAFPPSIFCRIQNERRAEPSLVFRRSIFACVAQSCSSAFIRVKSCCRVSSRASGRSPPSFRQKMEEPQPGLPEATSSESALPIVLCLSGGGIRATLFQLGILTFLNDVGRLKDVSHVLSVSGGSILAAHFLSRWKGVTKSRESFEQEASELIKFLRSDIRNSVVVPWLWSWLKPWEFFSAGNSRTGRMTAFYDAQYKNLIFDQLPLNEIPQFAISATDSIKQERVAFTGQGIYRFSIEDGLSAGKPIESAGVRLALAVTASSCFPPAFPRMKLTHEALGLGYSNFKDVLKLNDGGVTDNLGVYLLANLLKCNAWVVDPTKATLLVCDAERPLGKKPKDGIGSDLAAIQFALSAAGAGMFAGAIMLRLNSKLDQGDAINFPLQKKLQTFRTDLDAPSFGECTALMQFGYCCARAKMSDGSKEIPDRLAHRINSILIKAGAGEIPPPTADSLQECSNGSFKIVLLNLASIILIYCALLFGVCFALKKAWPIRNPHSLEINFGVYVSRDGGESYSLAKNGEKVRSHSDRYFIQTEPHTDGFLYLIQVDERKVVTLFHPQATNGQTYSSGANPVTKNSIIQVPPRESGKSIRFDHTTGTENFYCVFSAEPVRELEDLYKRESPVPPIDILREAERGPGGLVQRTGGQTVHIDTSDVAILERILYSSSSGRMVVSLNLQHVEQ